MIGSILEMLALKRQLLEAVRGNNMEEVIRILGLGIDINIQDDDFGQTPIFLAALYNNLPMVKKLAELGADLEARDRLGYTVLSRVVSKDNPYKKISNLDRLAVIKLLIKKGANLAASICNCCLPIHMAIQVRCSLDIVKALTTTDTINKKDIFGFVPLHLAVLRNRIDMVKFLIEHRDIDIDVQCDAIGDTPLMLASRFELTDIMYLLLTHNANPRLKNSYGQTFFHLASLSEIIPDEKLIKYLPSKPAEPKNRESLYLRRCNNLLFTDYMYSENNHSLTNPHGYILSNSVSRHRTHPYLCQSRPNTAELARNRYVLTPRSVISEPPRSCSTTFPGLNTPESSIFEISTVSTVSINLDDLSISTTSGYYSPTTTNSSELVSSPWSNTSESPQRRNINLPRSGSFMSLP